MPHALLHHGNDPRTNGRKFWLIVSEPFPDNSTLPWWLMFWLFLSQMASTTKEPSRGTWTSHSPSPLAYGTCCFEKRHWLHVRKPEGAAAWEQAHTPFLLPIPDFSRALYHSSDQLLHTLSCSGGEDSPSWAPLYSSLGPCQQWLFHTVSVWVSASAYLDFTCLVPLPFSLFFFGMCECSLPPFQLLSQEPPHFPVLPPLSLS